VEVMQSDSRGSALPGPAHAGEAVTRPLIARWPLIFLAIGIAALVLPTLRGIANESWSTEQGAHGPIVLAIAVWLFSRAWPTMRALASPGSAVLGSVALAFLLVAYTLARIVGSIMLESASAFGALLVVLYLFVGARAMRAAWFPLAYFVFVLPPPGSVVATLTQPLRLYISQFAVSTLALFGYPVARTGLEIFVGQYVLEVRAACGGLNSIISLSAIGLFYIYIRHNANVRYSLLFLFVAVAMAIMANFVRVVLIILITYYLGDRAAQGFLHQFAGMTMFAVAMGGVLLFDRVSDPIRRALAVH
jgi:exosortase